MGQEVKERQETNVWKTQVSVMQQKKVQHVQNSFEHEWQLNVSIKPSLKEMWLGFTLPTLPCVRGCRGFASLHFRLEGIHHCPAEDSCSFKREGWWGQESGYTGSLVISTGCSGYYTENNSCFLNVEEAWTYISSYLSWASETRRTVPCQRGHIFLLCPELGDVSMENTDWSLYELEKAVWILFAP